MKSCLLIMFMLFSQLSFSETLKEKQTREEMLLRVDNLVSMIEAGRESIKSEDMSSVCVKINEIFPVLREHLLAIGTKMDLFDSAIVKLENETKMSLIDIHRRKNVCAIGKPGENLDIDETSSQLKSLQKMLEKQKKKIKKADVGFENTYNYYYEFH